MILKVRKVKSNARIDPPSYEHDAGYDVYATESRLLYSHERYNMPLGICLEFPKGYVCLVQGKSGLAVKYGLDTIGNVIDSGYRGEIHAQIVNSSSELLNIQEGMKIAQLIFLPVENPQIEFVGHLSSSDRGESGFGSTGIF